MRVPFFDLSRQYVAIKSEIDAAIASCFEQSVFIGGESVEKFEHEFADFVGVPHAVSCANGTDALEMALIAAEIKPGDEVIVPACTWTSTAEAVHNVGATIVFADVDPKRYTMDVTDLRRKITPKTKAILPVHLYGLMADMPAIMTLAKEKSLIVIEDCAQAHGASINGKPAGSWGHLGCFSFYPTKNLGAYGDAGAIVTKDDTLATTVREIANHGQRSKNEHVRIGRNSRLDSIQAAVLCVKLKHLENWTKRRIEIAQEYTSALKNIVQTPEVPDPYRHVFHLYVIQSEQAESIRRKLDERSVGIAEHYPNPLPFLPAYSFLQHYENNFPIAAHQKGKLISLPVFPELTNDEVRYVIDSIKK